MNDDNMIKARRLVDGSVVQVLPDGRTRPFSQKSDWERVDAMTEQEVEANALSDPDNPPLTPTQLASLRRAPSLKEIRDHLHMTQEQFSREFDLPLGTVRDWEQGLKKPDSAARTLLRVIAHNPDAVIEALKA
jgi:putative transcriptional regulator